MLKITSHPWPWGGSPWNAKALKFPSMPIFLVGCPGIDPTGLPHDTRLTFVSLFIDPLFSLWEIIERAYENENFTTSASCYTKNKCSKENTVVKNRGLNFGVWRLGGGGREDVVIVTKFNPFLFFRAKLASFCHSPRPRNIIQAKAFTRCFWEHRRSIETQHQPSDPTPVPTATFGQETLHQWTSMAGQFGASWNTCISYRGWLVGFGNEVAKTKS